MASLEEVIKDLDKQIKRLNVTVNREIDSEIRRELIRFGEKLEDIARLVWDEYQSSYSPVAYVRTGRTREGIRFNSTVKKNDKGYSVSLEFIDANMYDNQSGRHKYLSMSDGWNLGGKRYMYDYYEGYDLIGKTIGRIKQIIPKWMEVEVKFRGSEI